MGGSSSKPEDIQAIAMADTPYEPPFGPPVKASAAPLRRRA